MKMEIDRKLRERERERELTGCCDGKRRRKMNEE
jgi:hypothetical protein